MKKYICLLLVAIALGIQLAAANKPESDGINFPEKMYGKPSLFKNDYRNSYQWNDAVGSGAYGQSTSTPWTVYVIKQGAAVYSSSTGSTTLKNTVLNFMEDFYVADLRGERVLLFYTDKRIDHLDYSYDENGKRKGIRPKIEDRYSKRNGNRRSDGCIGWVDTKDLLLWEICPRTEKGIFMKIAVVKNIDNVVPGAFDNRRAELYADPECKTHFNPVRYLNPLDFCFAFRRSSKNGNVLVYNNYQFPNGTRMENQQMGWIKNSEFINWNTRICWEPAFKGNINDFAYSFASVDDADKEDNHNLRSRIKLIQGKRKNAQTFPRFPVVDFNDKKSIATLSVLGIGNSQNSNVDFEKLQKEIQSLESSLKRINIVFVMDATNSMKPCFEAVKKAVDEISAYKYKSNNVYFGVVVYRNYKDEASGGLVQMLPLTNDCQRVSNFLSGVRCYSASVDPQEAMFYGLNYAADKMQWGGSISNFMILLTDVSTKDPDERKLTSDAISTKLANKKINLVSYQVKSQNENVYRNFSGQMIKLTESLLDKLGYAKTSEYDERTKGFLYNQDSAATEKKFPYRPMAVRFKKADDNVINPSKLTQFTTDIIEVFIEETDKSLGNLRGILSGADGEMDQSICAELISRGVIKDCKDLDGFTFKVTAYSRLYYHPYNGAKKMYTPCVFMSDKEYDDLLKDLKSVTSATSTNRREVLREAALKLILSYTGQKNLAGVSSDDASKYINEIEKECGYAFYNDVKTLIKNSSSLSDDEIDVIINRLNDEISHLEKLRNEKANYKLQDDHRYYYILLEDMPMIVKPEDR